MSFYEEKVRAFGSVPSDVMDSFVPGKVSIRKSVYVIFRLEYRGK